MIFWNREQATGMDCVWDFVDNVSPSAVLFQIHQKRFSKQGAENSSPRSINSLEIPLRNLVDLYFHRPGGGVTDTPLLWSELILVPLLLTLEPWKLACLGGSLPVNWM